MKKQDAAMKLRSHSIDKLNHYDRRIPVGGLVGSHSSACSSESSVSQDRSHIRSRQCAV
jgi:hypothetical protein